MLGKTLSLVRARILAPLCLVPVCVGAGAADEYSYRVLQKSPHDPEIFTQGLVVDGDWIYESSGLYGRSFLLRYGKDTDGAPDRHRQLADRTFAEGITIINDHLYLLSWRAGNAWRLDKDNLEVQERFRYRGEGWGLTHNGEELILSDGSDTLRFYDTEFNLLRTLEVRLQDEPLNRLNELEYHQGLVWANRWKSTRIFGIDIDSGEVEAFLELGELQAASAARSGESVLNGIAYDPDHDAFWITGKYWRHRYLINW